MSDIGLTIGLPAPYLHLYLPAEDNGTVQLGMALFWEGGEIADDVYKGGLVQAGFFESAGGQRCTLGPWLFGVN